MTSRRPTAPLIGGPLDGDRVRLYPARGGRLPTVVTLAHGCTDAEPWPHTWLDYDLRADGSYHYRVPA